MIRAVVATLCFVYSMATCFGLRYVRALNTLISVIKTSQLMLCREIMAVCSEIHTKHINIVCGQNVELLNVKLVVHIVTTGAVKG
jgi:hypothetical protein